METDKSQGQQGELASWERASGVVPVLSPAGSRPRKNWCFNLSVKLEKANIRAQKQAEIILLFGHESSFVFTIPLLSTYPKELKAGLNVYISIIHSRQKVVITQVSINE